MLRVSRRKWEQQSYVAAVIAIDAGAALVAAATAYAGRFGDHLASNHLWDCIAVSARRVLLIPPPQVRHAHVPVAFAAIGLAATMSATKWVLAGDASTRVLCEAEAVASMLGLAVCIRLCLFWAIRHELWIGRTAAGVLGSASGLRYRLLLLVLGLPGQATAAEGRP